MFLSQNRNLLYKEKIFTLMNEKNISKYKNMISEILFKNLEYVDSKIVKIEDDGIILEVVQELVCTKYPFTLPHPFKKYNC